LQIMAIQFRVCKVPCFFFFCAPCYTKYLVIFIYWIVFCIVGSLRDHGVPSRQPDPKEVALQLPKTLGCSVVLLFHSNSRVLCCWGLGVVASNTRVNFTGILGTGKLILERVLVFGGQSLYPGSLAAMQCRRLPLFDESTQPCWDSFCRMLQSGNVQFYL